jgi:hypothetical protein
MRRGEEEFKGMWQGLEGLGALVELSSSTIFRRFGTTVRP